MTQPGETPQKVNTINIIRVLAKHGQVGLVDDRAEDPLPAVLVLPQDALPGHTKGHHPHSKEEEEEEDIYHLKKGQQTSISAPLQVCCQPHIDGFLLLVSPTHMVTTDCSHLENFKHIYATTKARHVLEYRISPWHHTGSTKARTNQVKRTVAHLIPVRRKLLEMPLWMASNQHLQHRHSGQWSHEFLALCESILTTLFLRYSCDGCSGGPKSSPCTLYHHCLVWGILMGAAEIPLKRLRYGRQKLPGSKFPLLFFSLILILSLDTEKCPVFN